MSLIIVPQNQALTQSYFQANTTYEFQYDFDLASAEILFPDGVVLNFNGGSLDNGTLIGKQTTIHAPVTQIFKKGIKIPQKRGTWKLDTAYSDWFECYKNGYYIDPKTFSYSTGEPTYDYNGATYSAGTLCGAAYNDDTFILQQLLNLCAKHTIISEGIYMVSGSGGTGEVLYGQLTLFQEKGLTLQIDGILKMIPNNGTNFDILLIADCDHIKLCGSGKLVGDLAEHDAATGGEGGMCLQVNSTTNLLLEDLTFEQGWGDGLFYSWRRYWSDTDTTKSFQAYHTLNNIKCLYNRRTGLGLEKGDYIYVKNSQFNYTGVFRGTPTQSGVDIEPFSTPDTAQRFCKEIHFDNCTANFNANVGFRFQRLIGGSIKNSEASNNAKGVELLGCYWSTGDEAFFNPEARPGVFSISNRILIDGNTFKYNSTATFISSESAYPLYVTPDEYDGEKIGQPSSAMIMNNYVQNTGTFLLGGWKDTVIENNQILNTGKFFFLYDFADNVRIENNYVFGLDSSEGSKVDNHESAIFKAVFYKNDVNSFKDVLIKDNIFKYAGGKRIPGSNDDEEMLYPMVREYLFMNETPDCFPLRYVNNYFDDELWAMKKNDNKYSIYGGDNTMTQERLLTEVDLLSTKHLMKGDIIRMNNGQTGVVTVGGWIGVVGTPFFGGASYEPNQFVYSPDKKSMFIAIDPIDNIAQYATYPTPDQTTINKRFIKHIDMSAPIIEWTTNAAERVSSLGTSTTGSSYGKCGCSKTCGCPSSSGNTTSAGVPFTFTPAEGAMKC